MGAPGPLAVGFGGSIVTPQGGGLMPQGGNAVVQKVGEVIQDTHLTVLPWLLVPAAPWCSLFCRYAQLGLPRDFADVRRLL